MSDTTLYWYDYETFGIDSRRDRLAQFAGIRTDTDLNIIDDSLVLYCKPADDMLPDPESCLITGITPQKAATEGLCEAYFIKKIRDEFSKPNSCVVGYNNIRFDDEFTRNALYRNFFDPYEREWKNGCSRWDIIDMVRLTHALRPSGINWPVNEDGIPLFKLDQLTVVNAIEHGRAHDALADVLATIEFAKLIRKAQPKLYDFVFKNRDKHQAAGFLNVDEMTPVIHVSGKYKAERNCIAVVMPIAHHPTNRNGIIVYDLSVDPGQLIEMESDEIRQCVFTARDELPAGRQRIPLKVVHMNRCPILAPLKTLLKDDAIRLNIDIDNCMNHRDRIESTSGIGEKVKEVFAESLMSDETDPDTMLYSGGFFSDHDKRIMADIRSMSAEKLQGFEPKFHDKRLKKMLFRYRGRNFPESFTDPELKRWQRYCYHRLTDKNYGATIVFDGYLKKLNDLRGSATGQETLDMVDALEKYGNHLLSTLSITSVPEA